MLSGGEARWSLTRNHVQAISTFTYHITYHLSPNLPVLARS